MTNIILCGGNGTRLWPISRTLMPKQFVKLFSEKSLFQLTVERNRTLCDRQCIVSNTEQYFLAMDQLLELPVLTDATFLLEPVGRNTAPAIALACLALERDEIVLVTPSDHLIKEAPAYVQAVARAQQLAQQGALVTFGITPEYAETGYGYIEASGEDVTAFHEKPDAITAQKYLDAGSYYWNSGMFCFKAGSFLDELQRHAPEIFDASRRAFEQARHEGEMTRISHEAMSAIPEESIDYAVIERSDSVKVVSSSIGWSDLGSFDALDLEVPKDGDGNSVCEWLVAVNANNNFVHSRGRTVALADVDDLIVVDTPDAVMITKKGSSQQVKTLVKELRQRGSELPDVHMTTHRPWGTYTILDESEGYKVKRIVVKPGKRLSLQKHRQRSEHWVVVSGTANVRRGDDEYTVHANESTYIPMGEVHRLENIGTVPLVMIEAQVGAYVGEDDIIRLEDDYQRGNKESNE